MKVVKSPDDAAARTNCVFLSPVDFKGTYVIVNDEFAFTAKVDPRVSPGEIGTTLFHRKLALNNQDSLNSRRDKMSVL
jgi:vesicle-fusing ATPase